MPSLQKFLWILGTLSVCAICTWNTYLTLCVRPMCGINTIQLPARAKKLLEKNFKSYRSSLSENNFLPIHIYRNKFFKTKWMITIFIHHTPKAYGHMHVKYGPYPYHSSRVTGHQSWNFGKKCNFSWNFCEFWEHCKSDPYEHGIHIWSHMEAPYVVWIPFSSRHGLKSYSQKTSKNFDFYIVRSFFGHLSRTVHRTNMVVIHTPSRPTEYLSACAISFSPSEPFLRYSEVCKNVTKCANFALYTTFFAQSFQKWLSGVLELISFI